MVLCSFAALGLAVCLVLPNDTKQATDERVVTALFLVTKDQGKEPMSEEEFARFKRTQAVLMKSRNVMGEVVKKSEVAELGILKRENDPAGWLEQKLEVDYPRDGDVLRVSMRGTSTDELRTIANTVTSVYLQHIGALNRDAVKRRLEVLYVMHKPYQDAIHEKRKVLNSLSKALDVKLEKMGHDVSRIREQVEIDTERERRRIRLERVAVETRLDRKKALKDDRAESRDAIARLEEDLAVLTAQEKMLKDDIESKRKATALMAASSEEIEIIRKQIEDDETVAKKFDAEIRNLEQQSRKIGVRLIQPATVTIPN